MSTSSFFGQRVRKLSFFGVPVDHVEEPAVSDREPAINAR
jgi:hypothetical protein